MPCIGLTPFLRKDSPLRLFRPMGVNALHRAYSISTVIFNKQDNVQ